MSIQHIHTQRVAFTPAHVQLACDGVYLTLPLTRTTVGVWSLQDIACKPLELEGHSKILTSLSLGNNPVPKLLVSAAEDYVIIWNLNEARQSFEKGEKIKGRVVGTTLGYIQYSAFSPDDSLVAVCSGFDVVILQSRRQSHVATLEGHNAIVTGAEFCHHYTSTLVSISEDRTFKIWNLEDLTLVYQSPILTASPFLSVSMSLHEPHVAIGTADGVIRVFDLTDGNGFRCLHQIDVGKLIDKMKSEKIEKQPEIKKGPVTISSRPTWKQQDQFMLSTAGGLGEPQDNVVETGVSVLGLYHTYLPMGNRQSSAASARLPFLQNRTNVVKDLLDSSPMLLVGTTSGLLQMDTKSLELCGFVDFQEPIPAVGSLQDSDKTLNAAGCVLFGQGADHNQLWCIVGSPFQNVVHILQWQHATHRHTDKATNRSSVSLDLGLGNLQSEFARLDATSRTSTTSSGQELTVLSKESLYEDSPLNSELTPRKKDSAERKPRDFVTTPTKGKVLDKQPLTFKTKIKSSGYTEAPRMTMFKPKTSFSKQKSASRPGTTSTSKSQKTREYPIHSNPPIHPVMKVDVAERAVAVNQMSISGDGHSLACALANKSTLVFSLPLSQKASTYTGHNHIVTSVNWSQCGNRLITSSDDKTGALWVKGNMDPVIVFDKCQHNFSICPDDMNVADNKPFSREVHSAQFYFMDKFILLCSGNNMFLYKYYVDLTKNDIKRYLNHSRYKLVQSWPIDSQVVSAMSAINSFYSYIAICAGSNKSADVFDMNVGQKVRHMKDVHSRPVHAICQNEGSKFVSHPSSAYDLFATAAAGDCIKLWDLRTNRCVRRYEGHLNRVHPCGLAFSPCGRFLVTGSEDKCAYIYEMRSGTYLHKLTGYTDVISDVAFHPMNPQLYTSTIDGKVQFYTSR